MRVCTSFSPVGYKVYGKKFIESFRWHAPEDELWVFYEGEKPDHSGVVYIDLNTDKDRAKFLAKHGDKGYANGLCKTPNGYAVDYRFQAIRFSHKVFAMSYPDRPRDANWVWCDADVLVMKNLDTDWWEEACPEGFTCSYLGRKDWDHSETGWLAFTERYHGHEFIDELREIYVSEAIFKLPALTDSFAFDHLRKKWEATEQHMFCNLAKGVGGNHVWPDTILGQRLVHNKGPELKGIAYGAVA